jgi:hypothetical protein
MPSAKLPFELERNIFELAARHVELGGAEFRALLRMARRVYAWIGPFLYESIFVETEEDLLKVSRVLEGKPPEFRSLSAKTVMIPNILPNTTKLPTKSIDKFLFICCGITKLSVLSVVSYDAIAKISAQRSCPSYSTTLSTPLLGVY